MAKNYSSATFATLLLLVAAMTAPQIAFSHLTGEGLLTCWEAIFSFEGCMTKMVAPEVLNLQMKLTPQCCDAVQHIGKNCLSAIYPDFSFAPKLGYFLQGICDDYYAPAPQPTAATDY